MSIFRPPTDNFMFLGIPPDNMASQEERMAYSLFRHYMSEPRGRNVFLLADGTYTENEPSDMTTVVKTYYGGHNNEVDANEVASLTAAGYGEYIS